MVEKTSIIFDNSLTKAALPCNKTNATNDIKLIAKILLVILQCLSLETTIATKGMAKVLQLFLFLKSSEVLMSHYHLISRPVLYFIKIYGEGCVATCIDLISLT